MLSSTGPELVSVEAVGAAAGVGDAVVVFGLADATSALFISGFDALDLDDYLPLLSFKPNY